MWLMQIFKNDKIMLCETEHNLYSLSLLSQLTADSLIFLSQCINKKKEPEWKHAG